MAIFTKEQLADIIEEIQSSSEVSRRAKSKRRHDIYKDGGRAFLLEQIEREFSAEAVSEMRLAPINLLKKIVNKRSSIYKVPPIRTAEVASDQDLVDFYVDELELNEAMQKANRYFTLQSNVALYVRPHMGDLKLDIVPPFLYSIVPNDIDQTEVTGWIFSSFLEAGRVTPHSDVPSATGAQGFERELGTKSVPDLVASMEKDADENRTFIIWTDEQHVTTNGKGEVQILDSSKGDEQFVNPINISPVVNLAKDRDNEPWATQFEDAVDLSLAIMLGWTDLLTIAKHQGFSILTVVSSDEPKQLKIGVNKAVWLRRKEGEDAPTISYVQGNSPLAEYKDLLMDLLSLLLSSNDMPPNAIGGSKSGASNFTSGFHALIEMSDTLEAVEQDKPVLRCAEKDLWEVIKRWHNYLYDQGILSPEASSLGKFSEEFEVSIQYKDSKPVESEQEVIAAIKDLRALGLLDRRDAMKKLYPDLDDDQISAKIAEIDAEKAANVASVQAMFPTPQPPVVQ